jgi:NTE family protein
MLFHLGALSRVNELGLLKGLKRISSVSGGSITAGVLGLKWRRLVFDEKRVATNFESEVASPIRKLAGITIDVSCVLRGVFLPGSVADYLVRTYQDHLFGKATLQDLPDDATGPRFVINATNVQSGVLWRFSRPYMRDYRVGEIRNPTVLLAQAVAASSAFPPVLSPLTLDLRPFPFTPDSGTDLQYAPFTEQAVLTDGGVYDNLGLETAWKRYETVLVSDGGGALSAEGRPKRNWFSHAYRVLFLIDNQVGALRKRQVIGSYKDKARTGAYWGIRTDIADYGLADALPFSHARSLALANVATRMKALEQDIQEGLVSWGYAVSDAALRKHVLS